MEVTYDGNTFTCVCTFNERHLVKDAGFYFENKKWFTRDFKKALRLREYFSSELKGLLNKYTVKISKPWTQRLFLPEGKILKPVQIDAVRFAMRRNHSYLALEPGLGKTPTSVVIINEFIHKTNDNSKKTILLVVPPFLVSNWIREIKDWQSFDYLINVVSLNNKIIKKHNINIVPDSILIKDYVQKLIKENEFGLCIIDEAHRFNNESKRTEALLGRDWPVQGRRTFDCVVKKAGRVVYLSGTPFDKPIHLYPILSSSAMDVIEFRTYLQYGAKYCNGHVKQVTKTRKIFDVSGSSHEVELKKKLKRFMMFRRLKDHVNLKGFTESVVTLDPKKPLSKKIKTLENGLFKRMNLAQVVEGKTGLGDLATYRKEFALSKLDVVSEYLLNVLENTKESIIIFGIHIDLLNGLVETLSDYDPYLITGNTPMKDRNKIEKDFMKKKSRVLIANIKTMVGLNLTVASRGYFVESDWTNSGNRQARDRMNRIGQDKFCTFEHLTLADTLDEYILRKVINQNETINRIL